MMQRCQDSRLTLGRHKANRTSTAGGLSMREEDRIYRTDPTKSTLRHSISVAPSAKVPFGNE